MHPLLLIAIPLVLVIVGENELPHGVALKIEIKQSLKPNRGAVSYSTLRLEPRHWPGALAQDSAPPA